jgi:hypothetical protein
MSNLSLGMPLVEVTTVADITIEHYGWIIEVPDANPVIDHREIYLLEHRTWEYQGEKKVGLVSKEFERKFRGTEYHYPAETPCKLLRQWRKPKRAKKNSR